jgi:hypothetical protein
MNVSELFDLTNWVTNEIAKTNIPDKYQALHEILRQLTRPNQPKQPFESQKEDLLNTLMKVPLFQLTKDQLVFLEKLGIAKAVGKEGIEAIEDILYKNVIDVATSATKIQEIHAKIITGIQKSDQIKTGMQDCIFQEDYEKSDEVLMRVCFSGGASMTNVSDFKKWGNVWYEIGRGIAMAHGATPEDVRVIGATKGSVIIELAVIASIASTVSGIILAALKVAEKVLDIRKKAEELKNLKLKNTKLYKEIEKEAETEKKAGIEEITATIVQELKINREGQGDTVNALDKSVQNLVSFVEFGGEVDFVIPVDNEQNKTDVARPTYDSLKLTFTQIRELEAKIRLIEFKQKD